MVEQSPETHIGEIVGMEDDYAHARITKPDGQEYGQYYDTKLLQEAGINTGDRIQITFSQEVEDSEIVVNMRIKGLGQAQTVEEIQAEMQESMHGVDLDLVRKKFGSHM